jgi:hypothetical protein
MCQAELVASSVSAGDSASLTLLNDAGFRFVDFGLKATLPSLSRVKPRKLSVVLRPASPDDRAQVEQIALSAFHSGRYHADARFPRGLADAR